MGEFMELQEESTAAQSRRMEELAFIGLVCAQRWKQGKLFVVKRFMRLSWFHCRTETCKSSLFPPKDLPILCSALQEAESKRYAVWDSNSGPKNPTVGNARLELILQCHGAFPVILHRLFRNFFEHRSDG